MKDRRVPVQTWVHIRLYPLVLSGAEITLQHKAFSPAFVGRAARPRAATQPANDNKCWGIWRLPKLGGAGGAFR